MLLKIEATLPGSMFQRKVKEMILLILNKDPNAVYKDVS